jgi:phosphate transport system substrate-binding protein
MVSRLSVVFLTAGLMAASSGCGKSDRGIRTAGSDTMVNLAQAWAEKYHQQHPEVTVQVGGGGSGVGIASMIDGKCDMANASREMKAKELEQVKARRGAEAKEHIVAYDALAVYVHKDNPLDSITIEELAEIYGDGGKITKWSQLGVDSKKLGTDEITRVSRQNSSGTYEYFREAILGEKRDYKQGSLDQSGSKDVVALISKTPGAIGYSGMGYVTEGVKMLKIAKKKGDEAFAPTLENAKSRKYPITRSLNIYTVGEPQGRVKDYLDWIAGPEGQKVVVELGFVPK